MRMRKGSNTEFGVSERKDHIATNVGRGDKIYNDKWGGCVWLLW